MSVGDDVDNRSNPNFFVADLRSSEPPQYRVGRQLRRPTFAP